MYFFLFRSALLFFGPQLRKMRFVWPQFRGIPGLALVWIRAHFGLCAVIGGLLCDHDQAPRPRDSAGPRGALVPDHDDLAGAPRDGDEDGRLDDLAGKSKGGGGEVMGAVIKTIYQSENPLKLFTNGKLGGLGGGECISGKP